MKTLKKIWFKAALVIIAVVFVFGKGVDHGRTKEAKHQKKIRTTIAKTSSSVVSNGWDFTRKTVTQLVSLAEDINKAVK
jgi:hypothetical protein